MSGFEKMRSDDVGGPQTADQLACGFIVFAWSVHGNAGIGQPY